MLLLIFFLLTSFVHFFAFLWTCILAVVALCNIAVLAVLRASRTAWHPSFFVLSGRSARPFLLLCVCTHLVTTVCSSVCNFPKCSSNSFSYLLAANTFPLVVVILNNFFHFWISNSCSFLSDRHFRRHTWLLYVIGHLQCQFYKYNQSGHGQTNSQINHLVISTFLNESFRAPTMCNWLPCS